MPGLCSLVRVLGAALVVVVAVVGCAAGPLTHLHQSESAQPAIPKSGVAIRGYITRDGEYHAFRGWVVQHGDSLMFYKGAHKKKMKSAEASRREADLAMPASEVSSLYGAAPDPNVVGGSVVVGLSALLALGGVFFAIALGGAG